MIPFVARVKPGHARVLHQFSRFLVVGGISFAVDYGLYMLLLNWVPYLLASSISFTVSLVLNYVLTLKFVFRARQGRSIAKEFVAFLGLSVIALALNQAVLFIAVGVLGMDALAGKIVATAFVLVFNFITRKLLIERGPASSPKRIVRAALLDEPARVSDRLAS